MAYRRASYTLRDGIRLEAEAVDLIRRRTLPFIERGMHLPLDHVLGEAYLQGMRDAMEVLPAAKPLPLVDGGARG